MLALYVAIGLLTGASAVGAPVATQVTHGAPPAKKRKHEPIKKSHHAEVAESINAVLIAKGMRDAFKPEPQPIQIAPSDDDDLEDILFLIS